jgi:UDP-3-O-[3-hydroxymyristoyl] glucosamine N-acyltransferase
MSSKDKNAGRSFYIHPHALVETAEIGAGTRIWAFAHVMKGARIGRDCNIGDHCFIEAGAILGNNVTVKNGVSVWDKVNIQDNVFLGPNCVFTNDPNPRAYIKKGPDALEATVVRANATIGANATILCGLTVGKFALIGAGAVLLRPARDFALIVGNPGRQIGWMCSCARRLELAASALIGSECMCMNCKRKFICAPEGLQLVGANAGGSAS